MIQSGSSTPEIYKELTDSGTIDMPYRSFARYVADLRDQWMRGLEQELSKGLSFENDQPPKQPPEWWVRKSQAGRRRRQSEPDEPAKPSTFDIPDVSDRLVRPRTKQER